MNFYGFSGLLIAITSGLMACLMFFFGQNKLQYLWGRFCAFVLIFGIGIYFVSSAPTPELADFWWRIAHVGAIFIPVLFLHFVYEFLEIKKIKVLTFFYLLSAFFFVTNCVGDYFIANMRFVFDQFYYDSPPGIFYIFYTIMFFGLTIYSHVLLWKGFKKTKDRLKKQRIQYFFIGMGISFAGGGFNFLPVYGIDIYPYMTVMVFIYPLIISYAIFKHHLFDIKVIATGIFIFVQVAALGVLALSSDGLVATTISYTVLVGTIFTGFFLVRSVQKEIEGREQIEMLAVGLEEANKQLKSLDKLKSEFISLASHQLRSPLTVIKGYASTLTDGVVGDLTPKQNEIVRHIYTSAQGLASVVEDFLNVTKIEQGGMKYVFTPTDIKQIVLDLVSDMKIAAEDKHLHFSSDIHDATSYTLTVDEVKLKQVFLNLVDNSIKYTNEGFVKVSLSKNENNKTIIFSVHDSGVGISQETKAKLFTKFARGEGGVLNSGGSGLGLYLAHAIVKAHNGEILIESEGLGKGSTFSVVLPAVQ